MDNSVSHLCWHGCGQVGTLAHSLLFCPAVKAFWDAVRDTLSQILNIELILSPAICLLGVRPSGMKSLIAQKIVSLACLTTKRTILMNWKVRNPDCFNMLKWLDEFLNLVSMERAASALLDLYRREDGLWDIIRNFMTAQHPALTPP